MCNCFLSRRQFGSVPPLIIADICIHPPPPAPSSFTCAHATPPPPSHTHTHQMYHSCRAFTRLLKTGSVAGNMLVTYVARLLSLSEKLFVCGWAQAYVSPMTIRSGPSHREGGGGYQSLEEKKCGGRKVGRVGVGVVFIEWATLTSSGVVQQAFASIPHFSAASRLCICIKQVHDIVDWTLN